VTRTSIHAAKTQLSRLIARAHEGEDIVICKGKTPVARLVAIAPAAVRRFGAYRGLATVTDAFFEPLPDAELDAWEGAADETSAR
jgi:antitoxin (DNA-binding transcriptional repressor) of toxin-antitoxin stability system